MEFFFKVYVNILEIHEISEKNRYKNWYTKILIKKLFVIGYKQIK